MEYAILDTTDEMRVLIQPTRPSVLGLRVPLLSVPLLPEHRLSLMVNPPGPCALFQLDLTQNWVHLPMVSLR